MLGRFRLAALCLALAACKTELPAPTTATATATGTAPVARSSACAMDEIRESFCAERRAGATCRATGSDVVTFLRTDLLPSTYLRAKDAALATFASDTKHTMTSDGTCCYTRCSHLDVSAVTRPSASGATARPPTDGAYSSHQTCIAKPEAGTSIPAAANEDCPAAVLFAGIGFRGDWSAASPYSGGSNGRCCYRVAFGVQP